jgi:hypothetical protein
MNDITSRSATETTSELSADGLFDVFANERRRLSLTELAARGSDLHVETLARRVAARESDVAPDAVPQAAMEEVHVSLHHVHLPKLDDADLVEYDRDARRVELRVAPDPLPIAIE